MDRFKHLKSESLVLWYYELVGVRPVQPFCILIELRVIRHIE